MKNWLKKAIKSKGRHPGAGDGGFGPPMYQGMGKILDNPENISDDFVNSPEEIMKAKKLNLKKGN